MKKIITSIVFLACMAISLTSCQVNWFNKHFDVPWWVITIPVIIILLIAHICIISKTYQCPECKATFKPKWYEISSWLHMGNKRFIKCPKCSKKGFCDIKK